MVGGGIHERAGRRASAGVLLRPVGLPALDPMWDCCGMQPEPPTTEPSSEPGRTVGHPVRGSLKLTVSASSPQTVAGSDFSIFVIVQNPFEVPITLYQVQTHIPVELMDMNRERLESLRSPDDAHDRDRKYVGPVGRWVEHRALRQRQRQTQNGIATAIGTEVAPEEAAELFRATVNVEGDVGGTVAGVMLNFPVNPTSDELDAILRRFADFRRGVVPVTLQPGDSVVRQFVLRTRHWLLFTPLAHTFQLQATYSLDGSDHTATVPYAAQIQARTSAVAFGGLAGAVLGTLLKVLTSSDSSGSSVLTALAVSALATIAVVIAFARKTNAQSLVSVEDFWGGAVIGFSVGFFGFQQFTKLFPVAS
jgi:hypothetical protein